MARTFLRADHLVPFLDLLGDGRFRHVLRDETGRVDPGGHEDVDGDVVEEHLGAEGVGEACETSALAWA